MKITLVVEGRTETAFLKHLRAYLAALLPGHLPKLDSYPFNGRIPKGDALKKLVSHLLQGKNAAEHVIALTDVYTGTNPRDFQDAADAKRKMREWVGPETRFHPHAAQYEFEAWLLPFWPTIQALAKHNQTPPSGNPENVNHDNPPARRIGRLFQIGACRSNYVKAIDAGRILRDNDLSVAIAQCAELKALVNTILALSGGTTIP